jgi:hypothetical protein
MGWECAVIQFANDAVPTCRRVLGARRARDSPHQGLMLKFASSSILEAARSLKALRIACI